MKHVVLGNKIEDAHLEEFQLPEPGERQISISVSHSGLGMIDALQAAGSLGSLGGHTPGLEAAGTVTAIGSQVTEFKVGDTVAAMCFGGGLSSDMIAEVGLSAKLPQGMNLATASVTIVNTLTAWAAVKQVCELEVPEKVLVFAATGGLGSQFGQIFKDLGVKTVDGVVGSSDKAQVAKNLGYNSIFRRDENQEIPVNNYNVVVDMVGGASFQQGWAALKSGGRLLKVGNASDQESQAIPPIDFWFQNKSVIGFNVGEWLSKNPREAADGISWSIESVNAGTIEVPTLIYPIAEFKKALTDIKSGQTHGKLSVEWPDN